MKNGKSPHYYLAIFWFLLTITLLCSGATPERPYYSETPNPRHIQNNDRLTAEYFNNQLNVIYNWAQRTHTELDNLLHNGVGVASLTVGILNCTNKIINPEWDNLLHNGNGVASITANLIKTQDLEISNKIDVPAIEFSGRSQPTPPVNNGLLYFDSDLQRFRVYQENAWRDLSSNIVIASDSLNNPLVIQGYISASNIYATNSAVINKNLTVKGGMKIPVASNTSLGTGSIYYDPTDGKVKVLNEDGEWEIVGDDSTSIEEIDNRIESININMLASLSAGLNAAEASATALVNNASSSLNSQFNTAISNASSSLNTQFNNAITAYSNNLKSYIDTQDDKTLASATKKFITKIETGDNNGTVKFTKNGTATNVSVKGLGTAAYTASGTYVTAIAQGDNDGTIKYTKNGTSYNIPVKGLGSAAYANVASFSTAGAANSIPTIQPNNPTTGSIYWDTSSSCLKIYVNSTWRTFYPQTYINDTTGGVYLQRSTYAYDSVNDIIYSFSSGSITAPAGNGNRTSLFPMLQESTDGSSFTNVTGYQIGHFYCIGYSVIQENESYCVVSARIVFPVSSVILSSSVDASNNIVKCTMLDYSDIDDLMDEIFVSRGYNGESWVPEYANYGTFGTGSNYILTYNNKYYRFNFRTNNIVNTENIIKFDENFTLNSIREYSSNYPYMNFLRSYAVCVSGNFSVSSEYSSTSLSVNDQIFYHGTGIYMDIVQKRNKE